jgi:hypothetical protein
MSVHDPAKFQQNCVIFAKSAADTKKRMFFWDCALFMADTVATGKCSYRLLDSSWLLLKVFRKAAGQCPKAIGSLWVNLKESWKAAGKCPNTQVS